MKDIESILSGDVDKIGESGQESGRINEEAKKLVDMLFIAFEEHIKYFRANHPNGYDAAKREWTKTFIEVGISKDRVQKGIKKLRKCQDVYASLTPGEFLSLCSVTPDEVGAPDVNKAYLEACRLSHQCETDKNWSHVAVRYATHKTGSHFLRTESQTKTLPEFERNYIEACEMFAYGRILNTIEYLDDKKEQDELFKQKAVIMDKYKNKKGASAHLSAIKSILK